MNSGIECTNVSNAEGVLFHSDKFYILFFRSLNANKGYGIRRGEHIHSKRDLERNSMTASPKNSSLS